MWPLRARTGTPRSARSPRRTPWRGGPAGVKNKPQVDGDNPNIPRDPDRLLNTSTDDPDRPMPNNDDHKEKRLRFIPSGLSNEVMLDVYERLASFEPYEHDLSQRIFD